MGGLCPMWVQSVVQTHIGGDLKKSPPFTYNIMKGKKMQYPTISVLLERKQVQNEEPGKMCPHLATANASVELAKAIVGMFNFADRTRALDCYDAFRQIRRAFGNSFDFVFGSLTSDDFKLRVASAAAEKLRTFLLVGESSDVQRFLLENGRLVAAHERGPTVRICECYDHALLIHTGEVPSSFDLPVYLRLDVSVPRNENALLQLERILFVDKVGNSIAGLADIPEKIADVGLADRAFRKVLGRDYDVLAVNACLYNAWRSSDGNTFDVDVSEYQEEHEAIACRFVRESDVWRLHLVVNGKSCSLREIIGEDADLFVNWPEVKQAWDDVRNMFMTLSLDKAMQAVAFEHVFDEEHLTRLSDGFGEFFLKDPSSAGVRFANALADAIALLREDYSAWKPFLYHRGAERKVRYIGEAIDSKFSLMAPLYLTEEACHHCLPSAYLVACLSKSEDGIIHCVFPTVINRMHALMNYRHFCRMMQGRNAA